MDKARYRKILKEYLPEKATEGIINLLEEHPVHLKITSERQTKHGDFKLLRNGQPQITVNHNLNPFQFLLTLVHEMAHLSIHKKYKRVKPHGAEWKAEFRTLMTPFLTNEIFPNDTLPYLAQYFINPKAATNSDVQLSVALKKYDPPTDNTFLDDLTEGAEFLFQNKTFTLGKKRRTRYECTEKRTQKKYLIHQNTEVKRMSL